MEDASHGGTDIDLFPHGFDGVSRTFRIARNRRWLVIGALVTFGSPSILSAQFPESEYEPPTEQAFQTETVETQDKGQVTFTWGGSFTRADGQYASEHPASIEYGITDRWQVKFELAPSMARDVGSGSLRTTRGDWVIGTKRDFLNIGGSDIHVAAGFDFASPSDSGKAMSSEARAYSPYVVVAKDLPRSSRVFTQVGFDFRQGIGSGAESPTHVLNVSTGYYFPLREYLLSTELGLSTDRWSRNGESREVYFTPGLFRRLSERWWIGAGVPVGMTADSDKLGLIVALVYEFNVVPGLN